VFLSSSLGALAQKPIFGPLALSGSLGALSLMTGAVFLRLGNKASSSFALLSYSRFSTFFIEVDSSEPSINCLVISSPAFCRD